MYLISIEFQDFMFIGINVEHTRMSTIKLSRIRGDIWKQQCVFHYTYSFS